MTYRSITPETDAHLYIPGTDYLKPTIDIIFKMLMAANPEARKSLLTAVFLNSKARCAGNSVVKKIRC